MATLDEVLEEVQKSNRICPLPQKWLRLYEMPPDKTRKGGGWEPFLPTILGAWSDTPALSKILRFRDHIQWAADHGCLDQIFPSCKIYPMTNVTILAISKHNKSRKWVNAPIKIEPTFVTVGSILWACNPL